MFLIHQNFQEQVPRNQVELPLLSYIMLFVNYQY